MKTTKNSLKPVLLLILALAAGMMVQNVATAQGRRGGNRGRGMQRGGGQMVQRGGAQRGGSQMVQRGGQQLRGGVQRGGQQMQRSPVKPNNGGTIQRGGMQRRPVKPNNSGRGPVKPNTGGIQKPQQSPKPPKSGNGTRRPGIQKPTKPGSMIPRPNTQKPKQPQKPGKGIQRPGTLPQKPQDTQKPGNTGDRRPDSRRPNRRPDGNGKTGPNRGGQNRGGRSVQNRSWKHKQKNRCYQGSHYDCIRHCHYVRRHAHLHWNYVDWCGYFPTTCSWWYDWCGPTYYFDPTCCVSYSWYYCPVQVVYEGVAQNYSWHLGVNCVYIPGRGLGIQEVEAGSPAELAGLEPGMVIMQADGVQLDSETSMPSIIEGSSGMLNLDVISGSSEDSINVDVQMQKMASSSF